MCFSATASFTAAAVLGVVGCANIKIASQKRQLFLALVPLIFALQQLIEGFIWISSANTDPHFEHMGKYLFLTTAILIWPLWIPLALFAVEKVAWRRLVIGLLLALAVIYDAMMIYEYTQASRNVTVGIIGHSIQYTLPHHHSLFYYGIYLAVILLPPFISSLNYIWILGAFNVIGLAVAQYLYQSTFISVWCFFAAIVSISLYLVMRANSLESSTETERP